MQAVQKTSEARRAKNRNIRRTQAVRQIEEIEGATKHMSIFQEPLSQSIKPCRVAKQNFFAVGRGNAGQRVFHRGPRLWICRCDVGKIRFPENVVDTDIVAHLYADRFKPEIDINLPAEEFAGKSSY